MGRLTKRVIIALLLSLMVMPLLGFNLKGEVYENFVYLDRYYQPPNPSGVGTWTGSSTAWMRSSLTLSMLYDGNYYVAATDNYVNNVNYTHGTKIVKSGTTEVRMEQHIMVVPHTGTSPTLALRAGGLILRNGYTNGTTAVKGASFVDNIFVDYPAQSANIRNWMSEASRSAVINTTLSLRTATLGHSDFRSGSSYRAVSYTHLTLPTKRIV